MRKFLVCSIALALSGASTLALAAPAADTTTQLPRTVRPSHYTVAVTPHVDAMSFDGRESVDIEVLKPTDSITLNALNITFAKVGLTPAGGKALPAPKVAVDAGKQTATFTFAKPLAAGKYTLSMDYSGKIDTQAEGLFVLDYATKDGTRKALYTQFENSDARRFIPSWDEPAYKATFDLTATVPSGDMAVSNMPVAKTVDAGKGLSTVTFQTSPKMSTYLLFFSMGQFDRATTSSDGVSIGVVTQKGMGSQAAFALTSAKAVLHEYNQYFDVPYPLPKLDNIAAPGSSQFFSAMENWGAIFTFESSMLLDPSISTLSDKQNVFGTEAHEMAHQWFGDLVTMRWWDDLWLNEGFASWMASRTTEKLHPEWHTEIYDVGAREGAMGRDAVATTHPIIQHIETVEQANQAFDAITYAKGEAVIRMLENYLGADTWRDGVRRYIKANAYGNTVTDDLWKAMAQVTDKPIVEVAHDFTLQPGIPMIRVESAACHDGHTTVAVTQGEFTTDRPDKKPLRWHVPVIAEVLGHAPTTTLVDGKANLTLDGCGTVLVNAGQSGYYRTWYAPKLFDAVRADYAKLQPIDQLGVLSDNRAMGLAGQQPASYMLDLTQAIPADAVPQMISAEAGIFSSLDNYYGKPSADRARLRKFAIAKLDPVLDRLGWTAKPGEEAPVTVLRSSMISVLGYLGDPKVLSEARRRFAARDTDPKAVPPALRKVIYSVVAEHADAATWDALQAMAKKATTPLIKHGLYQLLGVAEDPKLAQRALDLAISGEPDATIAANMIRAVSFRHADMAFDFAVAHKAQVDKLVDPTSRANYYPSLAYSSEDPAIVAKLKAFADAHIAKSSQRTVDTVIVAIKTRNKVRADRLPQVNAWLKQHGS